MTPLEILTGARELLSDRGRWTKRSYARDERGLGCSSLAKDAVCWCAAGAILRTAQHDAAIEEAWKLAYDEVPNGVNGFMTYNDRLDTTHADILALFDRAIEKAGRL